MTAMPKRWNRRSQTEAASTSRARRLLRRGGTWGLLAWLAALGGAAYGLHRLEPYALSRNANPTRIEWGELPAWLSEPDWRFVLSDLEARLETAEGPFSAVVLHDENVCPYVAAQLGSSAWIERIERVSKRSDGRVRVQARFRQPFALVEHSGVLYLVDESGVRLPLRRPVDTLVIRGVRAAAPAPGQAWAGGDVAAGLKLAGLLQRAKAAGQAPFWRELRAIDVSNWDGRKLPAAGRLQLITDNPQSYIHWGAVPGEEYGVEAKAEHKLAALATLYLRQGRFPDDGPIDVRDENRIDIWLRDRGPQTARSHP